jgi:uncharacterized protein
MIGDRAYCVGGAACAFRGAASILVLGAATLWAQTDPHPLRGLEEVSVDGVELRGGFWGPRLKTHREVTIPHALDCLEKDGHVTNFDKAAGVLKGGPSGHHAFDSDLHKALEGALYALGRDGDPALRARVDGILERVLAAQQPDGFLISYFILTGLDKRWDDLRLEHQMYNAGHFFEAAVAHARLTGSAKVLAAAARFADHIDRTFGPGKRYDVDGHEEVELALVKLYRATGERRYLELARFFLDERGYVHGDARRPFDPKTAVAAPQIENPQTAEERLQNFKARLRVRNGRMQDHKPVVEQLEAVGHAVRAGYLYSAMADVVRFMEAPGYERALDSLWSDVVGRKLYLTGGVGTGQYDDEGFGDPYLLPNDSGYCESCAAIAHVLWQQRMQLLKGEAKYVDMLELALYNGVLSGIAIGGNAFFYENPLASGGARRARWIGLSCCPTNLARIIPQVGGLAYARGKEAVYINLYVAGSASIALASGATVALEQETDYPWDGRVRLKVASGQASEFELCLRIPGWAQGRPIPSDLYRFASTNVPAVSLAINGKAADATPRADGYVRLQRRWQAGDVVELALPLPIQRVYAHANVKDDAGKVALMRGPLVYCVEAVDHPNVELARLALPRNAELRAEARAELLGGVTVLAGSARADGSRDVPLTLIPYYAWANRAEGAMAVWVAEAP